VVGCTGFGSFTVWWDVLELVVLQCGGIYWSWEFYSVVGYTGVGSYAVWWDILDLVVLQCGGIYWSW
jgi:hypothetical protein